MLVIIKEVLAKMYFCTTPELSAPFYTTYTQHTYFILAQFSPPPKVSHNKFLYTHTDRLQMQTTTFTSSLLILKTPYPKNSAIMTRNDNKWRVNI